MAARDWRLLVAAVSFVISGCGGVRLQNGVFHSSKGFRVTVPGPEWTVVRRSGADLELRHRTAPAAMLANAVCERRPRGETTAILARHLLIGLRDRTTVAREPVVVNGRAATRSVLEATATEGGERVRIESYVVKDERCVYDLIYVARPALFETWRPDFDRFVRTFAAD